MLRSKPPLSLLFCVGVRLYNRARDRLPFNLLLVDTCDQIRHGHISLITASISGHAVYERADPAERDCSGDKAFARYQPTSEAVSN
jgi:hypothetical protein